jgi:hypothetical protein
VSYHTRILARLGCVELVKTKQVRGAVEHYYRAVVRPVFSDDDWAELPLSIRKSLAGAVLTEIADDMGASAKAGGFDRDEVHLSRTTVTLDAQGWQDLNEALQGVGERALEIQAESAARLQSDGVSDSEAAALVLMLFEPSARGKSAGRRAKSSTGSKKKKR